jgi:adenylosuccinate synthase
MGSTDPRSLVVVGGQWGDEGKGKVVDLLAAGHRVVVRYNGGHNAGHTVRFADRRFALHLVPSGIIHPDPVCYMGSGMVIDPRALVAELDRLAGEGIDFDGRLFLSPRAALILPTHGALDGAREGALGHHKIGTTGRGIGPAYQDQAQRRGLRAFLLAEPARLRAEAERLMDSHNRELVELFGAEPVDVEAALDELGAAAARLAPRLREVGLELARHRRAGDDILFEGAQGVMLDLVWGTYPFVTSSSCLPAAAAASCGVSPALLGPVLGIMKAYVTRVGGGPFPTELHDATGDRLREAGAEFGTTTGRPRRCGWFDAVAARYAVQVAGIDALALMKMDVLDGLDTVRIATAYRLPDGTVVDTVPPDPEQVDAVRPVLEDLPGWTTPTEGVTDERELAPQARAYLTRLEELLGVPIVLVSTGPRREETLVRGDGPLSDRLRDIVGS